MAHENIHTAILDALRRGDEAGVAYGLAHLSPDELRAFLTTLVSLVNRVMAEMLRVTRTYITERTDE